MVVVVPAEATDEAVEIASAPGADALLMGHVSQEPGIRFVPGP